MSSLPRKKLIRGLAGAVLLFLLVVFVYQCPIRAVFGIPCPGCGMTRALTCLLHGDLQASFYYHPILIPTGIAAIIVLYALVRQQEKLMGITLLIWAAAMIGVYIWRMIAFFPADPMLANENGLIFRLMNLIQNAG